jgi:hypothetical protein
MKPLKEIITPELLESESSRSNFRYGKQIAKDAQFKITKTNTFNHLAEIKLPSGTALNTALMSTTKGLRWKCDCTNKKDYFCEHCVALGLSMLAKENDDAV